MATSTPAYTLQTDVEEKKQPQSTAPPQATAVAAAVAFTHSDSDSLSSDSGASDDEIDGPPRISASSSRRARRHRPMLESELSASSSFRSTRVTAPSVPSASSAAPVAAAAFAAGASAGAPSNSQSPTSPAFHLLPGGDDDDPSFDLTEDIFHPVQQLRMRRAKWKRAGGATCSPLCAWTILRRNIPALTWIPRYNLRTDLLPDLLAGAMLSVVLVPQGMAYATLAGLPPIYGLYACITPPLVYAFLGCSRSMHIGPFALVSLLVAQGVAQVVPIGASVNYIRDLSFLFSILVGLLLVCMSVLRLGFAVGFLSDSVMSAYTCAAAFLILTSQWKSFLGLSGVPSGLSFFGSYIHIFGRLGDVNLASAIIGLLSVLCLLGIDELNARWKPRIPIPSQLVVVVLGILAVYSGSMDTNYHVKVVGFVPSGLPNFHIPGVGIELSSSSAALTNATSAAASADASSPNVPALWSYDIFKACIQPVAMTALIAYIISISIAKNFAAKENETNSKKRKAQQNKEEQAAAAAAAAAVPELEFSPDPAAPSSVMLPPSASPSSAVVPAPTVATAAVVQEDVVIDANQEMLALGMANLIGGVMLCYPAAGSLSRSALVYNAGVRSSLHNVFSVFLLLIVLLFLTPLLFYLPFPTLAAIVFTALKSLLLQVHEASRLYATRKMDFLSWMATFGATLVFDTQIGIAVGVLTSLLMLLKQTSRPGVAALGRLKHTDLYRNIRRFPAARTYKNVLIFRFDAPLHFANKDFFKEMLVQESARAARRQHAQTLPPPDLAAAAGASSADPRGPFGLNLEARWSAVRHTTRQLMQAVEHKIRTSRQRRRRRSLGSAVDQEGPELALQVEAEAQERKEEQALEEVLQELHAEEEAEEEDQQAEQEDDEEVDQAADPAAPAAATADRVLAASPSAVAAASSHPLAPLSDFRVRWVVLDCSSLVDVDDSALSMLRALPAQLSVTLVFCAMKASVRDLLQRTKLFPSQSDIDASSNAATSAAAGSSLPIERPFVTVHQAIKAIVRQQKKAKKRQA